VLETLLADVRYAVRWLRRSPGFTAVAIASFAIGIGFNTALFTLVDAVLFRPLPVDRPDRLVDVYTSASDGDTYSTSSYPDYLDFKAQNQVFTDVLGWSPSFAALNAGDRPRLALGEVVTGNYFALLGIKPALGRLLEPDDDRPGAARVTVLSHRIWTRDFAASPTVLGQAIRLHGQAYTVVGVAPPSYTGLLPVLAPEVWTTVAHVDEVEPAGIQDTVPSPEGTTRLERRGQRWMFLKGRLRPEATVEQAGANLAVVMRQLTAANPVTNKDRAVAVKRTSDVHLHPEGDRMLLPIATGLMVVVGLVLLIACANVASMLLARASGRQREIGIRLAVGASRRRLVQQLLTESLVIASLGAAAGIVLAYGLMRMALGVHLPIPIPVSLALQIDTRVLAFSVAVTVAAGVVAGLVPAFKATRPQLVDELKGGVTVGSGGRRRLTLRDGLVAVQIAVTMVLLVVSGLLTRSVLEAQRMKIGFKSAGLAVVSAEMDMLGYDDDRARTFWEEAERRVAALPGVEAVALTERSPFAINFNRTSIFPAERSQPGDRGITIDSTRVSSEYFATLGVPILEGRGFTTADTPASPGVVVVNEALVRKLWSGEDGIGKRFRTRTIDGPEFQVVGVVADYKVSTVGEKPTPYIHFARSQRPSHGYEVIARTHGDAGALLAAVRRELQALEPNVVFLQNQTMDMQVGATLLPAKAGAVGVSATGVVAMALAAIGLYGVIAYSVARRTREIGIRMALGARPSAVLSLVMRQGLGVAGLGVAAGALLAAVAGRALTGALYGIGAADPLAWTAAVAVLLGVSSLANLVPARRAARVEPSTALRTE
jgi:macrolide transport system ATP-binding/permease protein